MIPAAPNASATLFTLTDQGEDQTTWQGLLVNTSYRVFVAEVGSVVTVDTYARLGYEHALVVYDAKGNILADYRLEDLLTGEEIASHVSQTTGSRLWNTEAEFRFGPGGRPLPSAQLR